ncbi:MAG: hypothetical protein U0X92_09395 [Anaerolineales bacterium]
MKSRRSGVAVARRGDTFSLTMNGGWACPTGVKVSLQEKASTAESG